MLPSPINPIRINIPPVPEPAACDPQKAPVASPLKHRQPNPARKTARWGYRRLPLWSLGQVAILAGQTDRLVRRLTLCRGLDNRKEPDGLIQSGGGTGPKMPQQPAHKRVLV